MAAARILLVLSLVAAIADIPLPAASRARVRIHLVDRSDSVRAAGPADSLTPENADEIAAWDRERKEPGDTVLKASFGADIAFESAAVDPRGTDLEGALRAALARNPTEIVLHTDGRADPGAALLLCRARGVPVHTFPIGPSSVRDARLARVVAPLDAPRGEEVPVDVVVESTYSGAFRLALGAEARDLEVAAGIPAPVRFRVRAPARFDIRLEPDDACPRNNRASGEILARSGRPRVLVLSESPLDLPGVDAVTSPAFSNPEPYDAAILSGVPLQPAESRALASYVRDFGGGLLLMGGKRSFAFGWKDTPLDEISPLRASPDERVAAVFAIDASGSMTQPGKFDAVQDAVRAARPFFEPGDRLEALTFSDRVEFVDLDRISRVRPGGGTYVAKGMREARLHLEQARAGRKHVFVFTDGEVAPQEKPEERKAEAERLREAGIGLTVVTVNKLLDVGVQVRIQDWKDLEAEVLRLLHSFRGDYRENPGPLDLKPHPAAAGVAPVDIPWINRTSLREGAQLAASVGRPPSVDPAAAFRETGRGRVAAFAFPFDPRLSRLYLQSIEHVAGGGEGRLALSVDPPLVRARGRGPAAIEAAWRSVPSGISGTIRLLQTAPDAWEGFLPPLPAGTVFVKSGKSLGGATISCSREDEALGVDRRALERIAEETGGRVLGSSAELAALPRPSLPGRRSGRPWFLAAAAVLLLVELAISTFWKA